MMLVDNPFPRPPTTSLMAMDVRPEAVRASKVGLGTADYPVRLMDRLPKPPKTLWALGRMPAASETMVGIVGSRAASGAGRAKARALAESLGRRHAIVSGGAFGIDAAAHQGAVDAGWATFAVLGCGVDVVYPDRHRALFDAIVQRGGLISEYEPGTQPRRGQFPARNRLIAALSQVVVVVEAAPRSGALHTARFARKQGVRLCAVPGSAATDRLIANGWAHPVHTGDDVEEVLAGRTPVPQGPEAPVDELVAKVWSALREATDTPGGLARRLGLTISTVMGTLAQAEIDGWASRTAGDHYEARRGN